MAYCAYHKGTFSDIEQCPFCEQERIKRAKPGTTPSIEELISKWSNELVYSLDEAEIDLIEKIAPLILRDMAAAERGTTPPDEGRLSEIRQSIHINGDGTAALKTKDISWMLNELELWPRRAATQRAPVSKGDDDGMS